MTLFFFMDLRKEWKTREMLPVLIINKLAVRCMIIASFVA